MPSRTSFAPPPIGGPFARENRTESCVFSASVTLMRGGFRTVAKTQKSPTGRCVWHHRMPVRDSLNRFDFPSERCKRCTPSGRVRVPSCRRRVRTCGNTGFAIEGTGTMRAASNMTDDRLIRWQRLIFAKRNGWGILRRKPRNRTGFSLRDLSPIRVHVLLPIIESRGFSLAISARGVELLNGGEGRGTTFSTSKCSMRLSRGAVAARARVESADIGRAFDLVMSDESLCSTGWSRVDRPPMARRTLQGFEL